MASLLSTNPYRSFTIDSGNELPEGRRNMWNTLHGHGAKPTGVGEHLSGPLSPIQTDLTEEKDKQVQIRRSHTKGTGKVKQGIGKA